MSRWISAERGDSLSLEMSRRDRSRLARGSMEYSAVTQPVALGHMAWGPLLHAGAAQHLGVAAA